MMRTTEELQEVESAKDVPALNHYICPDRPNTKGFCGIDLSHGGPIVLVDDVSATDCAMCIYEYEMANYTCVICGKAMEAHAAYP